MRRGGRKQERWVQKPLENSIVGSASSKSLDPSASAASDFTSQSTSLPSGHRHSNRIPRNPHHPIGNSHDSDRVGVSRGAETHRPPLEVGESSSSRETQTREVISSISARKEDTSKEDHGSNADKGVVDIAERLRTLQFEEKDEETELREELRSTNNELQENELLVLESIYDDNFSIFETASGLKSFQIRVHVEAPEKITVTTNSGINNDLTYMFKLEHLPPIILTCLLPESYPSTHPPYFVISVQWLNLNKISELCSMLDSIWKEQAGQEIVYQWVDWLQNSALSHLCLDAELIIGPYNDEFVGGDNRAVSGLISPERDIPTLKRYSDDRALYNFNRNMHDCYICFSQLAGPEFVRLPCKHFFCRKCLKTYCHMHVKEGTLSNLVCPDTKCKDAIQPGLLKQLLEDKDFERWETLLLYKTLQSMSDVIDCPRCETPCISDDVRNDALCSKCFFSFCTLCREKRHVGVECMTAEMKLQFLQERQNSGILKENQRRREKEIINELLSVKEILRDAKQCPVCQIAISKTEGCNKMVCYNCGGYFCYRCNKSIDGYDHFRDGTCELFPQQMIDEWEAEMNFRFRAMDQAPTLAQAPTHNHVCPICGQRNSKVGNNNHILCWSCQNHYCYLCKNMVRRCSEHFGPKGCKQHTEG